MVARISRNDVTYFLPGNAYIASRNSRKIWGKSAKKRDRAGETEILKH